MMRSTCPGLRSGCCDRRSATAPATWGVAIDVPDLTTAASSEVVVAAKIDDPGAQMSTQVPQLLKDDLRSLKSEEATVNR